MTALFIFFQLQEARTVVILHLLLPFSLVYLEFPCAWPTVSDSLTTSRYVQEASGVPAATEGSIFPLLSAFSAVETGTFSLVHQNRHSLDHSSRRKVICGLSED